MVEDIRRKHASNILENLGAKKIMKSKKKHAQKIQKYYKYQEETCSKEIRKWGEKCTKNIRKIRRKHVPIPKILDNVEGNMYQKY